MSCKGQDEPSIMAPPSNICLRHNGLGLTSGPLQESLPALLVESKKKNPSNHCIRVHHCHFSDVVSVLYVFCVYSQPYGAVCVCLPSWSCFLFFPFFFQSSGSLLVFITASRLPYPALDMHIEKSHAASPRSSLNLPFLCIVLCPSPSSTHTQAT